MSNRDLTLKTLTEDDVEFAYHASVHGDGINSLTVRCSLKSLDQRSDPTGRAIGTDVRRELASSNLEMVARELGMQAVALADLQNLLQKALKVLEPFVE